MYSKKESLYTDNGGKTVNCAKCLHFIKPNSCELVKGDISPEGLSNYWEENVPKKMRMIGETNANKK